LNFGDGAVLRRSRGRSGYDRVRRRGVRLPHVGNSIQAQAPSKGKSDHPFHTKSPLVRFPFLGAVNLDPQSDKKMGGVSRDCNGKYQKAELGPAADKT
jgi:hypothetical protein